MAIAQSPNWRGDSSPSRSVENIKSEFEELDRLSQIGPAHIRLMPGPRRPMAPPGPGQYVSPPVADLGRLVRQTRRVAVFAAVMSTLALIMSFGAAYVWAAPIWQGLF